ncbi:MAG: hybrid sensor histidine kinase/response regulator [Arcobacter sp.]|nr:MAG: hybrid sensor histidine kinase/response regulator [Arcobacter sp.]
MKLKQLFILLLIANSIALMSVVFILSEYQNAIKQLENAYMMQHRSLILADELRQSSDDLTRMARTHVITGDEMFKEQFHTVLDIRNGNKPRPKNYNRIYWDFYTLKESKPILDGEKIPLRTLMKEAGFPEEELALLYKSQQESDDLTNLEAKAMNAIKGIFQDKDGNFTVYARPNFTLAREIMHGDQYHKAKIAIMKPLNEFYKAFETRTQKRVNDAHAIVKKMESYLSISVLFLIILFVFSFIFVILYRIIHPLEALNKGMLRLAKNDMDIVLPQKVFMDEVSEMIGAVEVFKDNAVQLISSQQQNKRLLDLAGEGIFGLDGKGRFIFVNPTASKLLGYASDELIGKYINKTIGKNILKKGSQQRERLMLISKEEQSFCNKNGFDFPIDYISTPIYNNKTTLEGSVVVFSDITKRKQHENELKKATLEAQKANRSKSMFLTNMSHELRTPLNAILGFATLLKKSSTISDIEKENLKTIHRSGQHLLSIINEILEFAKIEAGKVIINHVDTNLYNLFEDIESMFTARCTSRDLEFSLYIDDNVPKYIKCDEKRLRQILINILGNALKFTNEGSIKVKVTFKDSKLYIEVIDTGIGMNKEAQEIVFKPFEQYDEIKHKHKGTGLGLAITKELIEKMDGDITLKSKVGVGTKFLFWISVVELKDYEEVTSNRNKEIVCVKTDNKNLKILVADDTKANRDLLVQFLHSYKLNTFESCDGLEVMQEVKNYKFDLIFMDILMPNLDGIETIKRLKSNPSYKNIPIVAISANVFEDDKQKALDSGADFFLSKPFEEEDITQVLEKYLSLEFIYSSVDEYSLNKEELVSFLDKDVVLKINEAASKLDAESILKIIDEFNLSLSVSQKIKKLLNEYKFDEIIKFTASLATNV